MTRGLRITGPLRDPVQNIANGLRSERQMAVLLAMLDCRFHNLLNRGTYKKRRKLRRSFSDTVSPQFAAGIAAHTP